MLKKLFKPRSKGAEEQSAGLANYIFSAILVIIIASILILIQGSSPIEAFVAIGKGAVGSTNAIASSIRWSIPVIITAMSAVIAHKSGINNLGLEGQVYFGAFVSALVGAFFTAPRFIHILVAILGGAVAGMLYAVIPAVLKRYLKVNEMITTLMFNYMAILITEFLTIRVMGLTAATNPDLIATPEILETAKLKLILPPYQATTGIFLALTLVAVVWFIYRFTRRGYEWKLLGANSVFARYSGIKTGRNYMIVFLLSGAIAGFCGSVEILGPHLRFRSNFSSSLGWDGIMVALIAKNNPIGAAVVSVVWGMIKAGSLNMERMTSVNRILVTLLQALFVLFITVDVRTLILDKLRPKRKAVAEVDA